MSLGDGLQQYQSSWHSGSTESSRKLIYWTAAAIAVPVAGAFIWWITEKSINTIAPYQVFPFWEALYIADATHADMLLNLELLVRALQDQDQPASFGQHRQHQVMSRIINLGEH